MNDEKENEAAAIEANFSERRVIDIIDAHYGMPSYIMKALDCTEKQWTEYLRAHQNVRYRMMQKEDELVDMATKAVLENLSSDDEKVKQRAAETILKGLGKSRGWGENPAVVQNINGTDREISIKNIFGI